MTELFIFLGVAVVVGAVFLVVIPKVASPRKDDEVGEENESSR